MSILKLCLGGVGLRVLILALVVAAPAVGQDAVADLDRAIKLFDSRDFLGAQGLLSQIDESKLNESQRNVRTEYLDRVQVAITMSEKAIRDLEDAESAEANGELDQAVRLLERVLANDHADDRIRGAASARLRQLQGGEAAPTPAPQTPTPAPTTTPPASQPEPDMPTEDVDRARVLTEEAHQMIRAGRYDAAKRLFEEAQGLVPGYPEAVDGLRQVAEHEQNQLGSRDRSLIDRIREENRINWQRTVAEYREADRMIRTQVKDEQFDEAQQGLIRARQIVKSGKQFADVPHDYELLEAELDALQGFVDIEERRFNDEKVAEVRREVEQQRKRHLQEVDTRRSEQVEALMRQAVQHRKDGDLDAAINVLQQVRVIDPRYKPAIWMMDGVDELQQNRRSREVRDDFYDQSRKVLIDVEESKIPWHDLLRYPKDWRELITRPSRQEAGSLGPDRRLFGALETPVPVDFRDDPFDHVIERFATAHDLNIIVNWNDLKRAGVVPTTPVNLSLPQEITLKKALMEVLDQVGGGLVDLGFEVAEGAVKVATQSTLDKTTRTAVFDINDLLMEIPMFNDAPVTDLGDTTERAGTRSQQTDQPWQYGDDDDDEPEEDPQRLNRVQRIINLIQDSIAPGTWYERGGSIGTINEINGQLVVTQNSAALRQIGDLLGKLREQRAIQVAVEARFVTVSSHYLEDLGIDIDFVLNSGNAGFDFIPTGGGPLTDPVLGTTLLLPRQFSRLGFTPAVPGGLGLDLVQTPVAGQLAQPFGQPQLVPQNAGGGGRQGTPVPIISRVSGLTNPSNLGSDIPGSFAGSSVGPAFSLFGSFLDNIQVDFLVRATQADSRTTVLTAPRLVLINGQRSWVAVTVQQNFVSQLIPVVATGAVAQAPQIQQINSGAVLDVTATVTADKRYVTMTLRPGLTRLLDVQTFPFGGGAAGGGFGGGAGAAAFIQLPTLSAQRVSTTVSVPDGGTLLIGGQKLSSETEIEAGVPVLSKIPILKRLYSSRSMIKDEQTLLILVKPKILIQTEQEEKAFPSFR